MVGGIWRFSPAREGLLRKVNSAIDRARRVLPGAIIGLAVVSLHRRIGGKEILRWKPFFGSFSVFFNSFSAVFYRQGWSGEKK